MTGSRWSTQPALLLASTVAGVLLGLAMPEAAEPVNLLGQALTRLFEMAALPLLIVSSAFGLRQVMALPHAGRRFALMLALSAAMVVLAASLGVTLGLTLEPGAHLSPATRTELGRWVAGGGDALDMPLFASPESDATVGEITHRLDNPFAMLAEGWMPGILASVLFFSAAFARLPRERTGSLANLLEAVAHACEWLIRQIVRLLPLAAFALAVRMAVEFHPDRLRLVFPLLQAALIAVAVIVTLGLVALTRIGGASLGRVLSALYEPVLVGMFTPTPVAAIPSLIEGLSTKLGLSRGIVTLLVPAGIVMVRAGTALHVALIIVFTAQFYGHPLTSSELMLTIGLATAAAMTTSGSGALAVAAASTASLSAMGLPPEAIVLVVLTIDEPFAVLRNVCVMFAVATVCALAHRGLSAERSSEAPQDASLERGPAPLRLVLSGRTLALSAMLTTMAALLTLLAGVGTGMRWAAADASLSSQISSPISTSAPPPAASAALQEHGR